MLAKLLPAFRRSVAALTLTVLTQGAAHAGLVTGNWDPQFGSFLPGLSWQVRAELLIPDACSNQADGIYSTGSGACQITGNPFVNVWLRLFDTGLADPADFFGPGGSSPNHSAYWVLIAGYSAVSNVRIASGQVVGFDAGTTTSAQTVVCVNYNFTLNICNVPLESFPSAAGGNIFQLTFDTDGPDLACLSCRQNISDAPGNSTVYAEKAGLSQFLVTYTSTNTSAPKFTDGNGNALGAVLGAEGNYIGQATQPPGNGRQANPVPEPGSLALVFAALGAALMARRRG